MNAQDFCFWLQGYFELSEAQTMSGQQVEIIKNHLNLVFVHDIDPKKEKETTASKEELDKVHGEGIQTPGPIFRC